MRRIGSGALVLGLACASAQAGLKEYVAKPDPSYSWSRVQTTQPAEGTPYAQLLMTSQTWRGITWKHEVIIVRPTGSEKCSQALLILAGGSWEEGQPPRKMDGKSKELLVAMSVAAATEMPVACVRQIPFQPILGGLKEDQIISLTFDEYLKSGDEEWPLLLPMTKAAVRAMDAVQEFTKKEWRMSISQFIVTGASKRGWTTWLTGAADKRVIAIAPMVIDVLNMGAQMKHQREAYGGYSEQIVDYTRLNIPERMDTDQGHKLLAIVDPYSYREQLTMPKLILLGTNDPYWTLDSLNLYYDDLLGEKYISYVPNAGHGLEMGRVISNVTAFALKSAGKLQFPKLKWDLDQEGDSLRLRIRSDVKPLTASAWTTTSASKDFRKSKWTEQKLEAADGAYAFELAQPARGYAAVFGEACYRVDGHPLYLSTKVRMIGKE